MALKYAIESLDGLDEVTAALYTQADDGTYTLGVEGLPQPKEPDVTGLKKKVDELLAEKKASEAKRKEAEEAARKSAEEAARKAGDVGALEKSWKDKLDQTQAEKDAEIKRLNDSLTNVLVDNVAIQAANDIALEGSAVVLIPHIKSRLTMDSIDGEPVTRVLGPDGKPSAATIDELKAEFQANPAFAGIIAGSKASGGGASGARSGGATKKFSELTEAESIALYKKDPEAWRKLKTTA